MKIVDGVEEILFQERQDVDPDTEQGRALASERAAVDEVARAIRSCQYRIESPAGRAFIEGAVLLLGPWGTGKTHSLCDLALQRIRKNRPTLFVLGHAIPPAGNPIALLAQHFKLAKDSRSLLTGLNALGEAKGERALLIVDAINEGDREAWRNALPGLIRDLKVYPNVGLIVSCRTPFDERIAPEGGLSRLVRVSHPAFEGLEAAAQRAYFRFYRIPTPHYPLLVPEFTRPLFLKLFCEAVQGLSLRSKRRRLRDVTSGQKGLVHVFETFVDSVGKTIERALSVRSGTCWQIIKGATREANGERVGLAPLMARDLRSYATRRECLDVIGAILGDKDSPAMRQRLLQRMVAEGLLIESMSVEGEVVQFPYQLLGDHLIARELLRELESVATGGAVRRAFYRNRKLGRVFEIPRGWPRYRMPGLAAAIMMEFPERMKKRLPGAELEIVSHLPHASRLGSAVADAFLEGLVWRARDTFTPQTQQVMRFCLDRLGRRVQDRAYEVFATLATRDGHPYSAERLRDELRGKSMADRDLTWSEFIRSTDEGGTIFRLLDWVEKWPQAAIPVRVRRNAIILLSLFLTTTCRPVRDRITRALFTLGMKNPELLFEETTKALAWNDPYVPERMLAAAYGCCMTKWAMADGGTIRRALPGFARKLSAAMFLPEAPHWTHHALMRDYALGIITLALKVDATAIPRGQRAFLRPPFSHGTSVFRSEDEIPDADCAAVEGALHRDFENYTLGRLVSGRENYDAAHPEYVTVRRQILGRMKDLGYATDRFAAIDREIGQHAWYAGFRGDEPEKTDRYGKKYAWIAFFEMYGLQEDRRRLDEWRDGRTSDCDIDPSFPLAPRVATVETVLSRRDVRKGDVAWLVNGGTYDVDPLLEPREVSGWCGPWTCLDGYIHEGDSDTGHSRITFVRSMLIRGQCEATVLRSFKQTRDVGREIGMIPEEHYTFAGEFPWSTRCGSDLRRRDGRARRDSRELHVRFGQDGWKGGFLAEVPVRGYGWESYHSTMNEVGSVVFPAIAICEELKLVNGGRQFDLWDRRKRLASQFVRKVGPNGRAVADLAYLRTDLLVTYLRKTGQRLVWVTWGERRIPYHHMEPRPDERVSRIYQSFGNYYSRVLTRGAEGPGAVGHKDASEIERQPS